MNIQLENIKYPRKYVFIESVTHLPFTSFAFKFETVIFDAKEQENKGLGLQLIKPESFSEAWETLIKDGWKICG